MSIQSTTKTGASVVLTGEEEYGSPLVHVEFTHPKHGKCTFRSQEFKTVQGQDGIVGYVGSQRCLVTVPKADFEAAMTEARAIGEREVEDLKTGRKPITVHYHDGEYLSGYIGHGRGGNLLVKLGLADEVSGWGTHVNTELVNALGESFTYAQAVEFAKPALEAKAAKVSLENSRRQAEVADAVKNELMVFGPEAIACAGNRLLHSMAVWIRGETDGKGGPITKTIAMYDTAYRRMLGEEAGSTYQCRAALKAAGFVWNAERKEWTAPHSPDREQLALDLLRQHDTKADPEGMGLERCWECGRWCQPRELDSAGYCGC